MNIINEEIVYLNQKRNRWNIEEGRKAFKTGEFEGQTS